MMNLLKLGKITTLILFICLLPVQANAEKVEKDGVAVYYETLDDGTYKVIDVINHSNYKVWIYVDDYCVVLNAHSSAKLNKISRRRVIFDTRRQGGTLLVCTPPNKPATAPESGQQEDVQEITESPDSNK